MRECGFGHHFETRYPCRGRVGLASHGLRQSHTAQVAMHLIHEATLRLLRNTSIFTPQANWQVTFGEYAEKLLVCGNTSQFGSLGNHVESVFLRSLEHTVIAAGHVGHEMFRPPAQHHVYLRSRDLLRNRTLAAVTCKVGCAISKGDPAVRNVDHCRGAFAVTATDVGNERGRRCIRDARRCNDARLQPCCLSEFDNVRHVPVGARGGPEAAATCHDAGRERSRGIRRISHVNDFTGHGVGDRQHLGHAS